jgi:hypothetical protein
MSYGTIKVDTITFTDNSVDKSVSLSGLIQNPTFTGNITVTGTISGDVIRGGTTVSGATVTGTTANFVSGVFTTQISGATVTGTTASFTSGVFTNISGTTATITSGIIASGTAAAPSLAILADLDTGLFSPGANELAVATNGTGRLFVDASGNVKIGSTDNSTVATTYVAIGNPGITPGGIQLWSTTAGNSYIQFGDGTSATDQYRGYLGYVHSSDSLVFGTSTAERLRITSAGLVGVGTSAPSKKFEVANGDVRLSDGYTISWGDDAWRIFRNGSQLRFDANGTQALTIDSSQRVGIGTSSPDANLDVRGSNASILISDSGRTQYWRIQNNETNDALVFNANDTSERMRIDSSGRVGIGTTSPGNLLHVSGTGTVCQLASSNNNNLINLKGNGATNGVWLGTTSSDDFVISSGASVTERARIDSSGRLGIGTSSPSTPLEVAGAVGSGVISDYLSLYYPQSYGGGGSGPRMLFKANDIAGTKSTYAGIWSLLHANTVGAHSGKLVFGTTSGGNLVERLRIDESGNVGIGTTSPSTILHVASTAPYIRIQDTDSSTGVTAQGGFEMYDSDGDRLFYLANESSSSSDVSLFNNAGGALKFGTSGSERGQFDSSGRLLVGTSTGYGFTTAVFAGNGAGDGPTGPGTIALSRGIAAPSLSSGNALGHINFTDNAGAKFASIDGFTDATPGSGDYPGRLQFSVTADGASSPTERMRISRTGDLLSLNSDNGIVSRSTLSAGTANTVFIGQHSAASIISGTNCFYIFTNGNVVNTNNSYGAISDLKLKENIIDANSQWDDLKALQVRNYNFKEGQTHTQIGLVAQEAELVSPGLVTESPDRDEDGNDLGTVTKSVNYSVLYMKAVKALQEAMERIETLEAKVAALETP